VDLSLTHSFSGAVSLGCERATTLLVYHADGVEAVALRERPLVLGRDSAADVVIRHPSLSRQHARLELRDGEVWITDLGSTNGSFVNDQRVDEIVVHPGDQIRLGSLNATLHALGASQGPLQGLLRHDRFLEEVEREIVRHRLFERTFGVLMISASTRAPLVSWCAALQQRLRCVDRLGLYGPTTIEVLLPEIGAEELAGLADRLVADASPDAPLLCGSALFPASATTAAQLLSAVRRARETARAGRPHCAAPALDVAAAETVGAESVVVRSLAMKKLFAVVERMARSSIPVLILGETGTGKEVIARAIHHGSGRGTLPCINSAAIPSQLIESVLFGHEKGAFTGADRQRRGVFEEADGGSVFLDEIGELSLAAQAALLRVLDTKVVSRIGSSQEIPVNVRIIAATHRNLDAMVEAGTFRRDLLFRINTMTLRVPPLRERAEEIEPLCEAFLREANESNGSRVPSFEGGALELLRRYAWPGNVRELRNVVQRAVVLAEDRPIGADDLPEPIRELEERVAPTSVSAAASDLPDEEGLDYKARLQRYEVRLIREALQACEGNRTRAAQRLRIPLRTLMYKIQAFGIGDLDR
jgi:DNA-binding NtrC family response regulator